MLMAAPAAEGIDLFKKGNVVITVEQNSLPQQSAVVDGGEL